ncbi:MAG TPA: M56 family metallopeptidase [Streptosporangiaceae bacterium]|nr:M56 family metallopeptidase [Streptosporangiaceae bacterium]
MTGGLILAGYAVAAGFGAPAALRRGWVRRSPRIAVAGWLTLAASWLAAAPLAVLAFVVPLTWPSAGMRAAGNPGGTPAAVVAGTLVAAVVLRASWHLSRGLARAHRGYRAHAALVAAAGRADQALGAVILDDDTPAAYCLPRGRHRVVISAGALALLGPGQLQAVLAHERAHLRGRHHLMLTAAAALARAFPVIPLFAYAPAELAVLAEMTADDTAARRHDPADLAAALVTLATASSPATVLTAGGTAAIARIQRLLAPPPGPGPAARAARLAAALTALALAAAIAFLPLVIAACGIIARA